MTFAIDPSLRDVVPTASEQVVEQVAEEQANAQEDAEAKALLAQLNLDHVPTIEEAKALLAARRAEIRRAVLVEADARDWCEEGTRKVCANLRLERPGGRDSRLVEVEMTIKLTTTLASYTPDSVMGRLRRQLLNSAYLRRCLYVTTAEATPLSITVDGAAIDLSSLPQEKKPEVSA